MSGLCGVPRDAGRTPRAGGEALNLVIGFKGPSLREGGVREAYL